MVHSEPEPRERHHLSPAQLLLPRWQGGLLPAPITRPAPTGISQGVSPTQLTPAIRWHLGGLNAALDFLAGQVVLFRLGNLVFVTFGLFVALGAVVSLAGAGFILVGQGLAPDLFLVLAVGGAAAVMTGAWLAGLLLDYRLVLGKDWAALRRPIFVSWGGLLGMPVALWIFAVFSGFNVLLLLDALARAVALGHAVGRLGCLCYGCCYGRPTCCRVAITYRDPQAKAVRVGGLSGVPLHPAALYEAILDVCIFLAVNLAAMLDAPVGVPTALVLTLYGAGRFGIEFLRNNDGRIIVGCLSLNHIMCFLVAAVGGLAFHVLVAGSVRAPSISWTAGFFAGPWLVLAIVPSALIMFLGFALHWRRVGQW